MPYDYTFEFKHPIRGAIFAGKIMAKYKRTKQKTFNIKLWKETLIAFEKLVPHFETFFLVLNKEEICIDPSTFDGKVDVNVYNGQRAMLKNKLPIFYIELEHKGTWRGDNFPFDDVQFFLRKQKFSRLDRHAFWVLFNNDYTNAGIIDIDKVVHYPVMDVESEEYEHGIETFYIIPTKDMFWGLENIERFILQEMSDRMCSNDW